MEGGWSWCVRKKRPVAYSEVGEKGAYKQCLMTTFFCKKETPCLLVCFVHRKVWNGIQCIYNGYF